MSAVWGSLDGGVRDDGSGWIEAFIDHCEFMRGFRHYHGNWQVKQTSLSGKMLPYDVRYSLSETGGSEEALDETEWQLILPLRRVTGRQVALN